MPYKIHLFVFSCFLNKILGIILSYLNNFFFSWSRDDVHHGCTSLIFTLDRQSMFYETIQTVLLEYK